MKWSGTNPDEWDATKQVGWSVARRKSRSGWDFWPSREREIEFKMAIEVH
jgi:hypothetical protein